MIKTHPLVDLAKPQDTGGNDAAVAIAVNFDRPIVQLFARNGQSAALAKKLKISEASGKATVTKNMTAIPLSSGQWILVGAVCDRKESFTRSIAKKTGELGYVSEQGDSRICITISGPKARELMSRGCRLDLHSSVTAKGFCAQTNMAQVGVLIHQLDDQPSYNLYVYSGFARSFWQWLSHTAEQFGYAVVEK